MDTYSKKEQLLDAVGIALMVPMAWAIWTLLCCVSA